MFVEGQLSQNLYLCGQIFGRTELQGQIQVFQNAVPCSGSICFPSVLVLAKCFDMQYVRGAVECFVSFVFSAVQMFV